MKHFLVCCAPAENFHWSSTQDSEQYFCQQLSAVGSQSLRQSWQWPQNQSVDLRESHYKMPRIAFFLLWGIKRFTSSCHPHSLPSVCLYWGNRLIPARMAPYPTLRFPLLVLSQPWTGSIYRTDLKIIQGISWYQLFPIRRSECSRTRKKWKQEN